jgi:uncharacterized protein (TIGR02996 family)
MSLTNAFLQAIIADPDDDTSRLIHADWLEDHGGADGAARAALIRAQVRLARLPEDHPERPALEDEADDLLAEHGERWAAEVSRIALEWDWRRGFIEQVTVSADAFREQGEELLACAPIREVRLLGGERELGEAAGCRHLERIETLDLDATPGNSVFRIASLRDQPLSTLLRSPHFTRLRSLGLAGHAIEGPTVRSLVETGLLGRLERLQLSGNQPLGDRAARTLAEGQADHLEELGLLGTNLTVHGIRGLFGREWPRLRLLHLNAGQAIRPSDPVGDLSYLLESPLARRLTNFCLLLVKVPPGMPALLMRQLAGTKGLSELQSLQLYGCRIESPGVEALTTLPRLAELRGLTLSQCGLDLEANFFLARANPGALRHLHVGGNHLGDTGAQALAEAPFFPRLLSLGLEDSRIAYPGLKALLGVKGPSLRKLTLDQNWVGPAGAELLAGAETVRGLTALSLNQCNLQPEGAAALAGSPHLSRLRVLSLQHNRLGNEGVQALAASPHLFRLQELYLDGNDLGPAAAEALLESPYLGRVRKLGLRSSYFTYTEHERLRARFGEGVVF